MPEATAEPSSLSPSRGTPSLLNRAIAAAVCRPLVMIFIVAAALRLVAILVLRPDPMQGVDSSEYDFTAREILAGHGLVLWQSFVRPPLYPLLVAFCYALGGIAVLQGVQVLLGAVTAVLVGVLSARLSGDGRVGPLAAAIAAIYPWSFQFVGTIASENLFTPLAVAALLATLLAADARGRTAALWAGVAFGFAALARNNLLVLAPPLVVWWWWRARALARPTLFALGILLGLLPFGLYQAAIGNGLVLGSSGGGLVFYAGNNPDAARWYAGDVSDAEWHALSKQSLIGPDAAALVGCPPDQNAMSCVTERFPAQQREAVWYRAAFTYITSRPAEWALLEARKLLHYWRPWVEPRAYSPAIVVISGISFGSLVVVALIGIPTLPRKNALFVLAVAVGATVAAVVWLVQLRYRFALLDPVLIATAAPGVTRVAHWIAVRFGRDPVLS